MILSICSKVKLSSSGDDLQVLTDLVRALRKRTNREKTEAQQRNYLDRFLVHITAPLETQTRIRECPDIESLFPDPQDCQLIDSTDPFAERAKSVVMGRLKFPKKSRNPTRSRWTPCVLQC